MGAYVTGGREGEMGEARADFVGRLLLLLPSELRLEMEGRSAFVGLRTDTLRAT